jgi:hypothetical protein
MIQGWGQIDLSESEVTKKRREEENCVILILVLFLGFALLLTENAATDLKYYHSYEAHSRQGTVVDAWSKHDSHSAGRFVVEEFVSYNQTENGMMAQRNCTLRGDSYDSEEVADLVAQQLVIGQHRDIRVSQRASDSNCLSNHDIEAYRLSGNLALALSELLFSLSILLVIALTAYAFYQCCQKWRRAAPAATVSKSRSTEMTSTALPCRTYAYAAVPTDDTSDYAGGSVAAQVLQPDGDEQYIHILV